MQKNDTSRRRDGAIGRIVTGIPAGMAAGKTTVDSRS
jgi:hypothetical protein